MTKISLKIAYLKIDENLLGANELNESMIFLASLGHNELILILG